MWLLLRIKIWLMVISVSLFIFDTTHLFVLKLFLQFSELFTVAFYFRIILKFTLLKINCHIL